MAWGNRSSYVVLGILLGGFAFLGFGGCSSSDKKNRDECGPGETRMCTSSGLAQECECVPPNSGGAPPLDSGIISGGSSGVGGASGASGSGGSIGSGGAAGTRPIIDGAAGSGGSLGTGATGGVGGGPPGNARLGAACATSVDCGAGLICITPTSSAFGGEGPAHGLCTTECGADAGLCTSFGANAVCLDFGTAAYCVESCTFGPVSSAPNPNKCHGRDEMACAPLFGATGATCTTDANCRAGELCDEQCFAVIPACLPQCNADSDCGSGRYCNPQTGLCRAAPKTGLSLGDECTQPPAGGTDACRGTCIGIVSSAGATASVYTCAETCTIGGLPSCGWAGPASGTPASGLCLFSSTIIDERGGPGPGDRGSCAQLCNCNSDCQHASFVCMPLNDATLQMATRRRGFCTLPQGNPGITSCGG
jgi:hypothetical protein